MAGTILTVIGARPQFIKAAPVSQALQAAGIREILVHTGQHYDAAMSDIFFRQLNIPQPNYHLEIGSGSHGFQTGEGLVRLEPILEKERPQMVLVYGDTNSTLAGALSAAKLHFPVAHVEAGLRSFNRRMPEELNRILTDHLASLLFTPTQTATDHLRREGITQGVHQSGDVMLDAALLFSQAAEADLDGFFQRYQLRSVDYALLTLHRAETTAEPEKMARILQTIDRWGVPVLFPIHPRTRQVLERLALPAFKHIRPIEPIGYFDMLLAEKHAQCIITDSGGVQKEAAFFEVPCLTVRPDTEWPETVETGWNKLVGLDADRLAEELTRICKPAKSILPVFGNGQARTAIAQVLTETLAACNPVAV